MKVLFIRPPLKGPYATLVPPIGLGYVMSVLRRLGHTVHFHDCLIERRLPNLSRFDVVGISSMFTISAPAAHTIAADVRSQTNAFIVMGGIHPSTVPKEILLDKNVDAVVVGEGEYTMARLIEALEKQQELNVVKGLVWRTTNNKIVANPPCPPINDLDDLPFPAYDLMPMDIYLSKAKGHGPLMKRTPFTSMVTSRGCNMRCIYCSVPNICGGKWRARSPENVVEELDFLISKYKIREIHFDDDNITFNQKRMSRICDLLRDYDITWTVPGGVAIWTLNRKLIEKIAKSGCFALPFGIESGDDYIRTKVIGKPINLEFAKKVIRHCKELGIWVHCFFILGLPGENEKTIRKTIKVALSIGANSVSFFHATPYPGTRLREVLQEKGYPVDQIGDVWEPSFELEGFTKETLSYLRKMASLQFFFRNFPKQLPFFLKIRSFDDLRFRLHLGEYFVTILRG